MQQSHLPEAAEILDILNRIEFEGLFYSHDKLADLQVDFMSWSPVKHCSVCDELFTVLPKYLLEVGLQVENK